MWIEQETTWRGNYRSIVPVRSAPGRYVRRKLGREYMDRRFAEIRAKLDLVQVLVNVRAKRAGEG